jgi:CHAT domain
VVQVASDDDLLARADAAFDHVQVDAKAAAAMAERVLALARAARDPESEVASLHALSYARQELGDPRALETTRAAIRIADRAGLVDRGALARRRLAILLAIRGQTAAALRELDAACASFDAHELARTYVFRIAITAMAGLPSPSFAETEAAVATLRAAGDAAWEARLVRNRGTMAAQRGDTDGAEADLRRARELYTSTGHTEGAFAAELQLVRIALTRGDLPEALARVDAIAPDEFSPAADAERELLRARTLATAGLMVEARDSLTRAQLFWDRSRAYDHEGRLEAARLTLLAGDPSAAWALATRLRARFTTQGAELHRARAIGLSLAASIELATARRPAVAIARAAARSLQASGWHEEARRIRLALAHAETMLGDEGSATADLASCRSLRRRGPIADRVQWWHVQALLRVAGGDTAGAQRAARTGLALLDRHRVTLGASELRATASAIGVSLARLGLRIALDGGSSDASLRWAERLRASALRLDPVRPPDPPALREARHELRLVTAELGRAARAGRTEPALLARQAELESAIRRRTRHARGPARPAPRSARRVTGHAGRATGADRRRLAAALGERALVELIELDGAVTALTLVDGRLHRDQLGPAQPVADEQDWLRFALTRLAQLRSDAPQRPTLIAGARASAVTLSGRLLAPLAPRFGERELVLVPTGPLHAMPWALLPGLTGRTLTVAPSAAIWLELSTRPPPRRGGQVALVSGPGLRHARSELNALAELYPAAVTLSGRGATVSSVLEALDGAAIAHLACHGRFRADSPLFSSLELADGPLNAYELQQLRRAPELVVLSACDLAVSSTHPGDELLGFASALLNMGTRSVIASSLPVVDVTAKRLMRVLHAGLITGLSPAAALAAAQAGVGERARAPTAFACLGSG